MAVVTACDSDNDKRGTVHIQPLRVVGTKRDSDALEDFRNQVMMVRAHTRPCTIGSTLHSISEITLQEAPDDRIKKGCFFEPKPCIFAATSG